MSSFLSYNIGGADPDATGLDVFLRDSQADVVGLFEVPWASLSDVVREFATRCGYEYYTTGLSSHSPNHTLLLSKYPFANTIPSSWFVNSGVISDVIFPTYSLRVTAVHLAPSPESKRVDELSSTMKYLVGSEYCVVFGDLNSIAPGDPVTTIPGSPGAIIEPVKYDAVQSLLDQHLQDMGGTYSPSFSPTVRHTTDGTVSYENLRLDYLFASSAMAKNLSTYRVIDTPFTRQLSDHFPIFVS